MPSSVQIMACRLSCAKPLSKPMLAYHQMDHWQQTVGKFESKLDNFHSTKWIWKCRLWYGGFPSRPQCVVETISKFLIDQLMFRITTIHDDVIKGKHFPRYWPFVRGIHRSRVNSPHKSQWRGALMFSLICALNKRSSKQSRGWWFETPSRSLWHYCNVKLKSPPWISNHLPNKAWDEIAPLKFGNG